MPDEREQSRDETDENPTETSGTSVDRHKGESASRPQSKSGGGQSDLGSQAGSTLAGRADQQDFDPDEPVDQPGSYAGGLSGRQAATQGEGFILQPDDQGAIENPRPAGRSDVERDADRSADNDSNIEGGAG